MGRHGENIRKRSDGRWEARYPVYDEEKERTLYRSVYGCTYEEVKAKRSDALSGLTGLYDRESRLETAYKASGDIFFATAAEEWLAVIKGKQKPSTYEKYDIVYRGYLEIALGKTLLSQITGTLIDERLSGRELSDSLEKSIYCVANRILQYAARQYSLTLPDLKKPSSGADKKGIEVFTTTEQARLLSIVFQKTDRCKLAVLLCLFTGLRLGEICALRWSNIDFESRTLSVRGTVQRLHIEGGNTKTALVETAPKSMRSKREIPLQDLIITLLFEFKHDKEYVFGGNKPLEPRTLQNHYKRILKEAQIAYKNFHALRHTYATNCIEEGADVKSLSEMLGHSNVQITLNYYVHPSMDTKRRYADSLCSFYEEIHGQILGKAGREKVALVGG